MVDSFPLNFFFSSSPALLPAVRPIASRMGVVCCAPCALQRVRCSLRASAYVRSFVEGTFFLLLLGHIVRFLFNIFLCRACNPIPRHCFT